MLSLFEKPSRIVLGSMLVTGLLVFFLERTVGFEEAENRLGRPLLFSLRDKIGMTPELDPSLIVFAYDDSTFAKYGSWEKLDYELIAKVVSTLAKGRPKAIFIDYIFASNPKDERSATMLRKIFSQPVPVVSGSFRTTAIPGHLEQLDLSYPQFRLGGSSGEFIEYYGSVTAAHRPYGPSRDNLPYLNQVGDITFEAPGWIKPVSPYKPDRGVRHIALFAADSVEIDGRALLVNGASVPLDRDGRAFLNWLPPEKYYENLYRFGTLIEKIEKGEALPQFKPSDVIVLLPLMHTGNTDFKTTVVGNLPGGFAQVTAINSVIRGNWLRPLNPGAVGLIFSWLLACSLFFFRQWKFSIFSFGLLNVLTIGGVFVGFVYFNSLVSWILPLVSFNLAATVLFLSAATSREIKDVQINTALKGIVPDHVLRRIKANPDKFISTPVEKIVTVMFIDVVGFSSAAERLSPKATFDFMKMILEEMVGVIHRHGGIVDKTLGDGLLGFFGFNPLTDETQENHADRALKCGLEIQNLAAKRCRNARNSKAPAFPVRLGIETGPVYVGNIGGEHRLEITVIGHTVNMAKRFEDAAEPFMVMIGPNSRKYLTDSSTCNDMSPRFAKIKHHSELIEAFEYNPFSSDPGLLKAATQAFRDYAGLKRLESRHLLPPDLEGKIFIDGKDSGRIADYSQNGLCVELAEYYANKVNLVFEIRFFPKNKPTAPVSRFPGLVAIVRWGRASGDAYRHGLEFNEASMVFTKRISDFLTTYIDAPNSEDKLKLSSTDSSRTA